MAITKSDIAKANESGKIHWEHGLGYKPTRDGRGSWVVNLAARGKEQRHTLGRADQFTYKEARDRANKLQVEVRAGRDPLAEQQREQERSANPWRRSQPASCSASLTIGAAPRSARA
jgi:hypothetical protein